MGPESLKKYLEDNDEGRSAFAKRAGVSAQALSDWLSGRRSPDVTSAVAISKATEGGVTVESWARQDKRRAAPTPPRRSGPRTTKKAG